MALVYLSYVKPTKEQKMRRNQYCFSCIHRIPDMNTCFDGAEVPHRWLCELTRLNAWELDTCKDYERAEKEKED